MSIFDRIMSALGLAQPDPEQAQIAPVVVVKILDTVTLTGIDHGSTLTLDALKTQAAALDSAAYTVLAASFSAVALNWPFPDVTAAQLATLVSRAAETDPTYVAPKFDHFFEIICDLNFDTAGLAAALNAWTDVVEYAYAASPLSEPLLTGATNPLFSGGKQGYFSAAPAGIGVAAAWAKGATGAGVTVIDIERGWFTQHEDLPASFSILNPANNVVASQAHGTGVIGIIAGQDNKLGIIGAAPACNISGSVYILPATPNQVNAPRLANRILNAALLLPIGGVMLLEVQTIPSIGGAITPMPAEIEPLVFEAIRLTVATSVIVVEAGANGQFNLDNWTMTVGPKAGKNTLLRGSPDFLDSGAIMVGSATSTAPHAQQTFTNFGSRIDCYSWGENIVTSGWDSAQPAAKNIYWGVNLKAVQGGVNAPLFFSGTSGASPVIVGCVVLMQHLSSLLTRQDGKTGSFDPPTMRTILSTAANGTTSTDPIGVMPDFQKLLANIFTP